ncbi:4Fe-4S binding protein [Candidatus Bathyarchaeota archaeon]|nr:4Fe-4S binding protein [Candidatus Bathyarchaeota archaeon]MBS7613401.1 4Fe-4S binding protein [Candidatus Bathyarchaeota archaeon]MBS7618229.1 4Fe-4S binding protein [Candidatus Bathyarchaeota archaeon]
MVKVLLRFHGGLMNEPITSTVILEKGVKLNILKASIHEKGGEMLVEIPDVFAENVIEAFKSKGVEIVIKRTISVDLDRCIHCGECLSLCPVDVIKMSGDYSIIFDEDKCVACGLCVDACPMRAISLVVF